MVERREWKEVKRWFKEGREKFRKELGEIQDGVEGVKEIWGEMKK